MYFYVFLCIFMYFYVFLCIFLYFYVFLCIFMYFYVFLCIFIYLYVFLCIFIFIIGPLVILRYFLKVKWLKSRKLIGPQVNFFSRSNLCLLSGELIIISMIPTPFLLGLFNNIFLLFSFKNPLILESNFYTYNEVENLNVKYNSNDIFSLLILIRIILLIRIFMVNTLYYSNSSHRIW